MLVFHSIKRREWLYHNGEYGPWHIARFRVYWSHNSTIGLLYKPLYVNKIKDVAMKRDDTVSEFTVVCVFQFSSSQYINKPIRGFDLHPEIRFALSNKAKLACDQVSNS
jgi:hypothetical protein